MRQEMSKEAAEEVLRLPRQYTKSDLRRAYTKLARRYHPDAAAKYGYDEQTAQRLMVEANKANDTLRPLFEGRPNAVVERGSSIVSTVGAGGRAGSGNFYETYADQDIWETSEGWSSEASMEKPPLNVRSVLLGPVVLRVVLVALFAYLWWCTFPLLDHNRGRFFPAGEWTLLDVAALVAAMVYPTYLVAYEAFSGQISGLLREVLNGVVSWVTRRYVDLRPRSSSYGCALYKLIRNQLYFLLLAPIALYLIAWCLASDPLPLKIAFGVAGGLLAFDTLAAFVHGGLINVWTSALSERVEATYLLIRRRLLGRCGIAS